MWPQLKEQLRFGCRFPLQPVSDETRRHDTTAALERGNHKSAQKRPETLRRLIADDVVHGFQVPFPKDRIQELQGIAIAPYGITDQLTIDEKGDVVPKVRLTHDQSWAFSEGQSVNERVIAEEVTPVVFGDCIRRIIHYIVGLRRRHPHVAIFIAKFDWKAAYRRAHFNAATAMECVTAFGNLALMSLRLTFGGAPCPSLWSIYSEICCDLANDLIRCEEWDVDALASPHQAKIPGPVRLPADVPFGQALEVAVDLPADDNGKNDNYLDDAVTVTLDLEPSVTRSAAAVPLAMHVIGRPLLPPTTEPIPRDDLLSLTKLQAEGTLEETKTVLGWHFNTRQLRISLPDTKVIAWKRDIQQVLDAGAATNKTLATLIGRLNHVGYVIPNARHFLGRLRRLQQAAEHGGSASPDPAQEADLRLWLQFLDQAQTGLDMNLLTYRAPTHAYRSDASEHGIGGFSALTGRAWRWEIPKHLRLRVSLNMLEFLGSVVGPWLDFLLGDLPPLSCILSQTDSTTAAGWLNGTNFSDDEKYHLEAARKYAELMIQAQSVLASQWIPGILNDIADALSRDFHLTNHQILSLFLEFVPEQMPPNLQICQLPPTICSWLTSFLEARPPTKESPKIPQRSKLALGAAGWITSGASTSITTPSLTDSSATKSTASSAASPLHSERVAFQERIMTDYRASTSKIPWAKWHRPSGLTTGMTQPSTAITNPRSFYSGNSGGTRTKTQGKSTRRPSTPTSSTN